MTDYIVCEECGKNVGIYDFYDVSINGLTFELCQKCTDNSRHNADYIKKAMVKGVTYK